MISPISRRAGSVGESAITVIVLAGLFSLAPPASAQEHLNRFFWGSPYTATNLGLGFGAKPVAMGGAYMAVAEGLSGADYNPAGLASLRRPEYIIGARLDTQTIHVPSFDYYQYDWYERYASTAYVSRLGNLAVDHAGGAFRIKAGKQSFTLGLSYRRGLGLNDRHAYTLARYAPSAMAFIPPETYIRGELNGTEDYAINDAVRLDVFTATIAFRIAKNIDFGLNVSLRDGRATVDERVDYAYAVADDGVELMSWNGYEQWTGRYSLSGGANVEFGLLWKSKRFSVAGTFRTAYHVNAARELQSDRVETYSFGEVYEWHDTFSYEFAIRWPMQLGLGLAVRPVQALTLALEYRRAEGEYGEELIVPNFGTEIRAGAEYGLTIGSVHLPLRAGGFFARTDLYETSDEPWISGLCFGTGFPLGRLTLDIGAIFHSKTVEQRLPMEGPLRRSFWSVTTSLSYRVGKTTG